MEKLSNMSALSPPNERVESESALKNPTVARARFILTLGVVARKPSAPLLSRRFCSLYDKEVVGERSLCALIPARIDDV
jgi:hypothetical protein